MPTELLEWAKALQAHAQNGLHFANDPFDKERYAAVQRIASRTIAWSAISPWARPAQVAAVFTGKEHVRAGSVTVHVTTELATKASQGLKIAVVADRHQNVNVLGEFLACR